MESVERLQRDLKHLKEAGLDSGALYERVCKYLAELMAYKDTGLEPEEIKERNAAYIEIMTRTYGPIHQKISQWLQGEKEGRLVVLPAGVTRESLSGELASLADMAFRGGEETYTTGYRNGHKNGVIETLRRVLGIPDGTCQDAKTAIDRAMKGSEGGND